MNIGIDPEILAIGTEMAVYHLEKGARKFTEYAKAMIADLGDVVRPYLKAFYNGARDLHEVQETGLAKDMTPYDEVRTFDVANFEKRGIDVFADNLNLEYNNMEKVNLKDAIKQILMQRGCEMFYGDIAEQIKSFQGYRDEDIEILKKRISTILSKEVKNKGAIFARVPNGRKNKGKISYKKGIYKYKTPKCDKPIIESDKRTSIKAPKESPQLKIFEPTQVSLPFKNPFDGISKEYYGKGGEFAVASELLFRGFNTNMMTVDDGIDIIASKNKQFYFIQVKSRTWHDGYTTVQIDKNSYSRYNNNCVFYIIVIRYIKNSVPTNTYLVLPTAIIEKCIYDGTISESSKYYTLSIKQEKANILLTGKDNNGNEIKENINAYINNFNYIK